MAAVGPAFLYLTNYALLHINDMGAQKQFWKMIRHPYKISTIVMGVLTLSGNKIS